MVNATNRYYHQQCFKCSRCSNNLSNEDGFNMENGMLFCSVSLPLPPSLSLFLIPPSLFPSLFTFVFMYFQNCFTETYGVTCSGCGQSISANELWVEALERNWHPQCFVCAVRRISYCHFYTRFLSLFLLPFPLPPSLPFFSRLVSDHLKVVSFSLN